MFTQTTYDSTFYLPVKRRLHKCNSSIYPKKKSSPPSTTSSTCNCDGLVNIVGDINTRLQNIELNNNKITPDQILYAFQKDPVYLDQ